MASYERLTVAQLKEMCEERDIDYTRCKLKRDLVDALIQNDLQNGELIREYDDDDDTVYDGDDHDNNVNDDNDVEYDVANSDHEIQLNERLFVGDNDAAADNNSESESVIALKLKLALVRRNVKRLMRSEISTSVLGKSNKSEYVRMVNVLMR